MAAAAHPAVLKPEHIEEVIQTGKSSLPSEESGGHSGLLTGASEYSAAKISDEPPFFELSVRRPGPLPAGTGYNSWEVDASGNGRKGSYSTVEAAIIELFDSRAELLVKRTELPEELYHFTVRMPHSDETGRGEMLREFFRAAFGLDIRVQKEMRDVYLAKLARPGNVLMRVHEPGPNKPRGGGSSAGAINLRGMKIGALLGYFEPVLGAPVLDETGLTNRYDIHLRWKMSKAEMLPMILGWDVVRAFSQPSQASEKELAGKERILLLGLRGKLSSGQIANLSAGEMEAIELFRTEWAKPEKQRFGPSPEAVLEAAREQLGLSFVPAKREMEVVIIEAVEH